ncbi:MAG: hypothetical protein U0528_19200 [Anaerolineae bacterium]|nr:hypothetical protein [Anaerolineae bacterium]
MAEVLLQYVINERGQMPVGQRVLADGTVQRPAEDNALPSETERLDLDRAVNWQTVGHLEAGQVQSLKEAITSSGFFNLEPRLLINYCKDDPGTAIWTVNVDGQSARVVVFDPRPRRSAQIDKLMEVLKTLVN